MTRFAACFLLILAQAFGMNTFAAEEEEFKARRAEMVAQIASMTALGHADPGRAGFDPAVMAAMGKVARHRLVPFGLQRQAYENRPLPIGHGQTISQPYIVALMTDLLRLKGDETILEVGTGSGYQAAILAELAREVYTIEIIEPLADEARERLRMLGYANVHTRIGDGYYGWADRAPFDGIVVTAAASHIPPPLIAQLRAGGRMVIPVGAQFMVQHLMLVEKNPDGTISTRQIVPVRFVPLVGGQ